MDKLGGRNIVQGQIKDCLGPETRLENLIYDCQQTSPAG